MFLQREYRSRLGDDVRVATHSPTRDLIAIAEDNKLTVHRLADETFQKLFGVGFGSAADSTSKPLPPITALTWRPDGRTLALGHNDGSFSVYDIESKTKVRMPKAARPHSERVTCLHWEKCEERTNVANEELEGMDMSSSGGGGASEEYGAYDAYDAAYASSTMDIDNCIRLGPSREGRTSRLSRVPTKPRRFENE